MHISVDGKWEWQPWSMCTKTCGPGGTRTRSTECIEPLHGGNPCPAEGETTQTEDCHMGDCRKYGHMHKGVGYTKHFLQ